MQTFLKCLILSIVLAPKIHLYYRLGEAPELENRPPRPSRKLKLNFKVREARTQYLYGNHLKGPAIQFSTTKSMCRLLGALKVFPSVQQHFLLTSLSSFRREGSAFQNQGQGGRNIGRIFYHLFKRGKIRL